MGQLFELTGDRLLYLRMQVSRVEHRDAAGEIDVALPLHVPQLGVACPLGVHGE